jgi:hypothetical protein
MQDSGIGNSLKVDYYMLIPLKTAVTSSLYRLSLRKAAY